jgi:hypothetical protein
MAQMHRAYTLPALVALLAGAGFDDAGAQQQPEAGGQSGRPAAPTAAAPRTPPPFNPDHAAAPEAVAVRTGQPITLDGRLDEPAWMSAQPVIDFWQFEPVEGIYVTEPTEVRFLYDDDAIYVGAWLWDSDGVMPTRLSKRDISTPDTEVFAVHFDTYHDHLTSYNFRTNPSGSKNDRLESGGQGGGGGGDPSFNPIWEVKTSVGDDGWFVEMRVPFSQMRFSQDDEQVWGLQLERKLRPVQENTVWAYTPKREAQGQGRYGHLRGIRGIKPGRKLEVMPYAGARAEYVAAPQSAAVAFANPFRDGSDYFSTAGLDLKYKMTSNLTLDGAVNPDFGQVEVDPAVINLTAFETRFAERRPFFIEGAEIFDFGSPGGATVMYSRRIGRAPRGSIPGDAVYNLTPTATTILGAGKLSGKTTSGWSLAVLDAVTARERASWLEVDGGRRELEVEPLTNYFAGRARREMREGQTRVGFLATAVNRSLGGSPLRASVHEQAYSGGVDLSHEFGNRTWDLDVLLSPSWVGGASSALVGTQRSSARYFHRPDADYLQVDSSATSLAGYAFRASINKIAGLWRWEFMTNGVSPGYEVNDLGFQTNADRVALETTLGYEQTRRGRYFLNWNVYATPEMAWNYGGDRIHTGFVARSQALLPNYARANVRAAYYPRRLNARLTRGGPLTEDPASWSATLGYNTDTRTRLSGQFGLGYSADDSGAWQWAPSVNLEYKASETLEMSLGPSLTSSASTAQYVTTVTDPTATSTFGRRYVFADLRQTTLSMDTRVYVALTPEISFEIFAQPLLSSGDYESLKELEASRTFRFLRYARDGGSIVPLENGRRFELDPNGAGPARAFRVDNRDFNVRSLRSNVVFRWEWRPGSTVYVVWQQMRSGTLAASDPGTFSDRPGRFAFGRDARELFELDSDDILLIKASYWFNP